MPDKIAGKPSRAMGKTPHGKTPHGNGVAYLPVKVAALAKNEIQKNKTKYEDR